MKKVLYILFTGIIIFALAACGKNQLKTNTISKQQLTDREKMFLSFANDEYFAFDFKVDDSYKWVEVWVDKYELGKKGVNNGKISTGITSNEKGMILVTVGEFEDMTHDWTLAVKNENSIAKGKFSGKYKAKDASLFANMWGSNNSENIAIGDDEIILGSICYIDQSKDTAMNSLSSEFYKNPDKNIDEISSYDLVYLIKCKFYEKNPIKNKF